MDGDAKMSSRALKDIVMGVYSQQSVWSYSESAAKERKVVCCWDGLLSDCLYLDEIFATYRMC